MSLLFLLGGEPGIGGGGEPSMINYDLFWRIKADDAANVIQTTDQTFAPADVITGEDRISLPDLSYPARSSWSTVGATRVYFDTTGTLPSPLVVGTPYYLSPHASGGYEIYPEAQASDYANLQNIMVEETIYPAQNWAQTSNKINLTTQGTGTHRVYSDPLIREIANVAVTDFSGKVAAITAGKHANYEQREDGSGRKYILSELTCRDPNATGSYAIRGNGFEFSGDRLDFQSKMRSKRTVGVIAVLSWDETRQRSVAKTPIISTNVNTTTGLLTYTGENQHQITTARKVKLRVWPGGAFPTGLDGTTTYYGRSVSTTTVTLHPTANDATNNTNVIIPSSQGTGGFTIVDYQRGGDGERYRFLAEVRQPATGGNTATVRSNSIGWGEGTVIMETDIVTTGTGDGNIGAIGRTIEDLVPTTADIHEVDFWWPDGATPPTLSTGSAMTRGTYWLTRTPGSSIYARLHASLADAQLSLGLSTADATCLKFNAAGEGYARVSSNQGRPVNVSTEQSGGAILPNFWTPNIGTTEVLSWIIDYNNPDASTIQTWVYRNGILEGIAEGTGTKGLTDSDTNIADTGLTFLNSPQGHVPFEGKVYDFVLISSSDAVREENLAALHASLLSEYAITPDDLAPYEIFAPTIVGDPINGQSVTVDTGTWAAYPTPTFTYQWQRDGANITGETNASYTIVLADVGSDITCEVTATNSEGSKMVETAAVEGSPSAGPPVNVNVPSIYGPPVDAKTIYANVGMWSGVPAPTYTYQWRRNGTDISGETGQSFSPVTEVGNTITVRVTGTNASGSASATSPGVVILPEGSFTPPDNFALTAWYDPSDLGSIVHSGGAVSQLNDKTGTDLHATQATGSLQPTTGTRTIGGLNVLDFDNRTEEMNMPAGTLFLGNDDSTVFVVGNLDSTHTSGCHFFRGFSSSGGSRYFIQGVSSNFAARMGSGSSLTTAHNTSDHIFAIRRSGSTFEFWIDGTLIGTRTGTADTLISELKLGYTHDGKLGETIFLSNAASATEMNEIGNYLAAKWAQTWNDI